MSATEEMMVNREPCGNRVFALTFMGPRDLARAPAGGARFFGSFAPYVEVPQSTGQLTSATSVRYCDPIALEGV